MSGGSRQDQYSVTVSIDGVDYGVWDKMDGGDVDSSEQKYNPGGMVPEISLGGKVTVSNLKVSRIYDLDRDHGIVKTLIGRVGKGSVIVKKQPLDVDGNVFGNPIVYNGKLKMCTPPVVDSESNNAALIELEVSTAATVG